MSDNKTATSLDRKLISLKEEYEARDWTKALGCTRQQLDEAVAAVGHSADAVRKYLAERK